MNISWLIKHYENRGKRNLNNYIQYYKSLKNINQVITCATLAKLPQGKKHFHQRRLKKQVMESVKNKLLTKANEICSCSRFEEILKIVKDASEKGFGDLAIYDTTLRIGAFLNIYPEKVYLHAGTLEGAKAMGLYVRGKDSISLNDMPSSFKSLKAYEIEDFLCIYKKKLQKVNTNTKMIKLNTKHIKRAILK